MIWARISPVIFFMTLFLNCSKRDSTLIQPPIEIIYPELKTEQKSISLKINEDIKMENYFSFIDSVVCVLDTILTYPISEHILIRANPWVIETLRMTDYYQMKALDSFVYDQKKMVILPRGSSLEIPDAQRTYELIQAFEKTRIDVNLPEFKLRIFEGDDILFEFPIRIGKNKRTFLEMSGKMEDLRTKTGSGQIIGYNKNPRYVNPVNNHEYFVTRRDDGLVTKLPQIPFIEPEINGQRYGQLIHPTTNPETLGRASSNGCVGTKEGDAWVIYYYSPIGTRIQIRYDIEVKRSDDKKILLEDIYNVF